MGGENFSQAACDGASNPILIGRIKSDLEKFHRSPMMRAYPIFPPCQSRRPSHGIPIFRLSFTVTPL